MRQILKFARDLQQLAALFTFDDDLPAISFADPLIKSWRWPENLNFSGVFFANFSRDFLRICDGGFFGFVNAGQF